MSIPPKFLSKNLRGWVLHKYSDFIFYVATTKNNKFDFGPYLELVKYIAIYLSESLNFLWGMFFIVKQKFLDC